MKTKILIFILVLFSFIGYSQIPLLGNIEPGSPNDTYPVFLTEHGYGTIKQVDTYAELFQIPIERLVLGNLASVADSSYQLYQLTEITPIMTWVKLLTSGSASSYVFENGLINENDTIRFGGDISSDRTIGVGNNDLIFEGGDQHLPGDKYTTTIGKSFSYEFLSQYGPSIRINANSVSASLSGSYTGSLTSYCNIGVSTGGGSISGTNFSFNLPRIGYVYNSVYIGGSSGLSDTNVVSPLNNVGIGWETLKLNYSGERNTAIGYGVLRSNDSSYNTGVGNAALWSNITGENNTAIGQSALALNISGTENTAAGRASLYYSNGSGNTAIGSSSGELLNDLSSQNTNPFLSTYIGYGTTAFTTQDTNSIVIGANAKSKGSNKVVIGDDNITDIYMGEDGQATIHATNLGITSESDPIYLAWDKDYNDLINIPSVTDNQFVIGTGTGIEGVSNLIWDETNGSLNLSGKASINYGGSTFVGENSGKLDDESNNSNVGFGNETLKANVSGQNNTAIGKYALYSFNGGEQNTAVGGQSFIYMASGYGNVALGFFAGSENDTGETYTTSSEQSVYLGSSTQALTSGTVNEIVIGFGATGKGDHKAVIGDGRITDTYIGENAQANLRAGKFYVSALNTAPSSATDTGEAGEIRITADYIYICVATDTWKRVAISTW